MINLEKTTGKATNSSIKEMSKEDKINYLREYYSQEDLENICASYIYAMINNKLDKVSKLQRFIVEEVLTQDERDEVFIREVGEVEVEY